MNGTTEFKGSIGRTWEDSKPWWPQPGFGWLGSNGGPIDTPNIDKLAANGLLYNNCAVFYQSMFAYRPQPSFIRNGRYHRDCYRLSWI
jgi:hypothetical protein